MRVVLLLVWVLSVSAQTTYKIQTPGGMITMGSEDYVAGVVAGESSVFQSDEALKAMAVAARSYAANTRGRHAAEGFDFCSTTHCQRYVAPSARSIKAAQDTGGTLLWFDGKPAFAVYSRSCGGETENVRAVWANVRAPYLTSHADAYCVPRRWSWSGSPGQIRDALEKAGLRAPERLRNIAIVRRTSSGRAQTLSLNGELVSASSLRFAIGRTIGWNTIRSEKYSVENSGAQITFRGSGEGHGVGLCQEGADGMGLTGKTFSEILAFYYPGTSLLANGLHWTRLSGENVVLYTMRPDSDGVVIGLAEASLRRWPVGHSLDIYVYPDLDAFRNATGEPGWVAARTMGTKIEMQPAEVLRRHRALGSTLEHEIAHCFVEWSAKPGLPVWFREGLVEVLTKRAGGGSERGPEDAALRQRQNRQAAEAAYDGAQARVQALVNRYGETAVFGWLKAGLPAEVKYSSASSAKVNSK